MKPKQSLKIILIISICGLLFSGYLSYKELFTGTCNLDAISCSIKTDLIAGLPACVYGFFMYLTILVISMLGLKTNVKKK